MSTATESIASRVARSCPHIDVLAEPGILRAYEVDGLIPAAALIPRSSAETSEIVRFAASEKLAVIPSASRTKLGIGSPLSRYDLALDLSRMNRVLSYEPRDLTLGVEPGVTFSALSQMLAAENQFLPLDPAFSSNATVGGIIASDSVSPLRQRFGGPRDFVLGMEFVTGYGAHSKSGGRVVKNVTGYDLHKPLIGSLGTLAVIARINFKTFPAPPSRAGFLMSVRELPDIESLFRTITNSPLEPIVLAAFSGDTGIAGSKSFLGPWKVFAIAAGSDAVVARHRRDFSAAIAPIPGAELVELNSTEFDRTYEIVREFPRISKVSSESAIVLRIAVPSTSMTSVIERLTDSVRGEETRCEALAHAFGLIYFALHPDGSLKIEELASLVNKVSLVAADAGAHARIEFAPAALKRLVGVWGPKRADFELMARVKRTFDPENILSPGRFVEGV